MSLLQLKKQMEIDFLKTKTYEEINDMFNHLNDKLKLADFNKAELLKKWWKYFDEESVAVNCNDEERNYVIEEFLKTIK